MMQLGPTKVWSRRHSRRVLFALKDIFLWGPGPLLGTWHTRAVAVIPA